MRLGNRKLWGVDIRTLDARLLAGFRRDAGIGGRRER